MKTKRIFVVVVLILLSITVLAQRPKMGISPGPKLQVTGRTNSCYKIEVSTNLVNWSPHGSYFAISNAPYTRAIVATNDRPQFYRAVALTSAGNWSYPDTCAEDDNINIDFIGYDVTNFWITATHPTNYVVTDYTCTPNFNNCPVGTNVDYIFTPLNVETFNNGVDILNVSRKEKFWRPNGMNVTVDGGNLYTNLHYLVLNRKISDQNSWPEFFVLYCDGNARLIPFPPNASVGSVCYGSSVIVGPAPIAERPFIDIASADYRTASRTLLVTYRSGGTAVLDFGTVTRSNAIVKVTINFPIDSTFCSLRSMYVADGNSDCDHVWWRDINNTTSNASIMGFSATAGTDWLFYRKTASSQRQSAPDIRISLH